MSSIHPVLRISSGTEVFFDCQDASNGQITEITSLESFSALDIAKMNPVFGPIYIEEAKPGDVLEVEFLDITPDTHGWTAIFPGFGFLSDDNDADLGAAIKHWRIEQSYATCDFGSKTVKLPSTPFCGEIGVARAQPGAHSTIPPYNTGGNLDIRHIRSGTKVFLPIEVDGALFSLGDGHALQGDGEVCGTAIETSVKARVRISSHAAASLAFNVNAPHYQNAAHKRIAEIESQGYYTTTGVGPDMLEAGKAAVRSMLEYMVGISDHKINKQDAYMLCSVSGDLQALEVVDMPNYVMGFRMPEYVLNQIRG